MHVLADAPEERKKLSLLNCMVSFSFLKGSSSSVFCGLRPKVCARDSSLTRFGSRFSTKWGSFDVRSLTLSYDHLRLFNQVVISWQACVSTFFGQDLG